MKKIIIILTAILYIIFPVSTYAVTKDVTVYSAENDVHYHNEGCKRLGGEVRPMTLEEAVNLGLTPCIDCVPPVWDEVTDERPDGLTVKHMDQEGSGTTVFLWPALPVVILIAGCIFAYKKIRSDNKDDKKP